MKFTIWCKGNIQGTYPGDSEATALEAFAKDKGHFGFEAYCKITGLTRDDHRVQKAEE